jgi:hypothetical protein
MVETRWQALTTISLGIGQGELGITPLQMANATALVANRGYYITPHIVKKIEGKKNPNPEYNIKHWCTVDTSYFPVVINGMEDVVNHGTAYIAKIPGIAICGKTGTAQNPHGKDHSIFFAFAPKDNPKIAIAVVVENAGFGATWAAPIASLMIEQYLTKNTRYSTSLVERMIKGNLTHKPILNDSTATKTSNIDWISLTLYVVFVISGLLCIYASVYKETNPNIYDMDMNYGKQLLWVVISAFIALLILLVDEKLFYAFAYGFYGYYNYIAHSHFCYRCRN